MRHGESQTVAGLIVIMECLIAVRLIHLVPMYAPAVGKGARCNHSSSAELTYL